MTQKNTTSAKPAEPQKDSTEEHVEETPFEAVASICSVLVVGLYILTFIAQNYVIPSGSMEKTLLIGDHLVVDRTTLAAPAKWMPLMHYREPQRNDIVVFIKPVPDPDAAGNPHYLPLVKRLIGVPGDHIHLHNGIVYINGVAQPMPEHAMSIPVPQDEQTFLDEFPSEPPPDNPQVPDSWSKVEFPKDVVDGDLVVPPGMYFMMGDNRHDSLDSRYWGFVPRANIIGRPLFNYWSFRATEAEYDQTGIANGLKWMGHVALNFFSDTRWSRTLHRVR